MIEGLRKPDGGEVTRAGPRRCGPTRARSSRRSASSSSPPRCSTSCRRASCSSCSRASTAATDGAERAMQALGLVGLEAKADAQAEEMSGGQRQRLAIALALVHDPQVVFLDEPTTGLDPQARRNLWDVIRAINEEGGKTVVLTTHYLEEAEELCDRVAIMDQAKVIALDTPAGLIASLGADVRISYAEGGEEKVLYAHDAQAAVLEMLQRAEHGGHGDRRPQRARAEPRGRVPEADRTGVPRMRAGRDLGDHRGAAEDDVPPPGRAVLVVRLPDHPADAARPAVRPVDRRRHDHGDRPRRLARSRGRWSPCSTAPTASPSSAAPSRWPRSRSRSRTATRMRCWC